MELTPDVILKTLSHSKPSISTTHNRYHGVVHSKPEAKINTATITFIEEPVVILVFDPLHDDNDPVVRSTSEVKLCVS